MCQSHGESLGYVSLRSPVIDSFAALLPAQVTALQWALELLEDRLDVEPSAIYIYIHMWSQVQYIMFYIIYIYIYIMQIYDDE